MDMYQQFKSACGVKKTPLPVYSIIIPKINTHIHIHLHTYIYVHVYGLCMYKCVSAHLLFSKSKRAQSQSL